MDRIIKNAICPGVSPIAAGDDIDLYAVQVSETETGKIVPEVFSSAVLG